MLLKLKSKYSINYKLQSFNSCFFVAKVEILFYFLLLAKCNFSTLINHLTNMCRTSYEPTVLEVRISPPRTL